MLVPDEAPPDGLVGAPEGLVERFCWFIEPELPPVEPDDAVLPLPAP